jgi:hypothetical protein
MFRPDAANALTITANPTANQTIQLDQQITIGTMR